MRMVIPDDGVSMLSKCFFFVHMLSFLALLSLLERQLVHFHVLVRTEMGSAATCTLKHILKTCSSHCPSSYFCDLTDTRRLAFWLLSIKLTTVQVHSDRTIMKFPWLHSHFHKEISLSLKSGMSSAHPKIWLMEAKMPDIWSR